MIRITTEDRKHASAIWTTIKRQAYGGNMQTAEVAIARMLAEQRERCAAKLDEWAVEIVGTEIGCSLQEAARRLRGETVLDESAPAAENRAT